MAPGFERASLFPLALDAAELFLVLADLISRAAQVPLDVLRRDAGHLQQHFGAGVGEVLGAAEAVRVEQLHRRLGQADGGEALGCELAHLLHARFGVYVELPACELSGQAHVLSTAADGERELVVGDDDLHRLVLVVEEHARDLGGLERVADEAGSIFVPGNDVDLLAAQLLHHRLHAAALHADAGADRVHVAVSRSHGDLGAAARLAGAGLDDDDAFGDLGNLHLEQLAHQLGRSARKDDLRPLALAEDVEHEGLHAIACAVALARGLLAHRQHRLGAPQVDDDVAALEAQRDAGDDLALAVLVVVEDVLALGIAGALDDDLLGGLRRDAPEALAVGLQMQDVAVALVLYASFFFVFRPVENLEEQLVAKLGLDAILAGLVERDLVDCLDGVFDFDAWHHRQRLENLDHALLFVVRRLDGAVLAEVPLGGLGDGVLQRVDQNRALDALVLGHLVQDHVQVDDGRLRSGGCHFSSRFSRFSCRSPALRLPC